MHSTDNMDDGYLGSGKRLWNSLKYYGRDKHNIEILEYCKDRKELKKREEEIVNVDLLNEELCMNLQLGGGGGISSEEHMKKFSKAGNEKQKWLLENDENFKKRRREIGLNNTHRYKFPKGTKVWLGKKHKEESKKKIGKANSIKQKGEKNSQYSTMWITDGNSNKKIKKDTEIPKGWYKGRNNNPH